MKGGLAAEANGPCLSALAPFVSASLDQLPLKLSQSPEDRQHQATKGHRGIGPGIRYRSEARTGLGDGIEHIEQIAC
jgi:hypothetical protein